MENSFSIRPVTANDMATLKSLILGLAEHERRPQDVTGTEDEMRHWLFDRKIATALLDNAHRGGTADCGKTEEVKNIFP